MQKVSAIIPSFNGSQKISGLCKSLQPMLKVGLTEIVFVLDGKDPNTKASLTLCDTFLPIKVIEQEKKGPAAARNTGINAATNEVLWFLGDDSRPEENCLIELLNRLEPDVPVQGRICYPKDWSKIPFVFFLENISSVQHSFHKHEKSKIPFTAVSSSNLLVHKDLIRKSGVFNLLFKKAIYEDTEWAYRLERNAKCIRYADKAIVIHEHKPNLRSFCLRMIDGGYYAALVAQIHPDAKAYLNLDYANIYKQILFNEYTIQMWFYIAETLNSKSSFCFFIYRGLLNYYHRLGLLKAHKEGII